MTRWVKYYSLGYLVLRKLGWTEMSDIVVPPQQITDNPIIWVKMKSPEPNGDLNDNSPVHRRS